MPLESASTIEELDTTSPRGTEVKSQGDDHLRLLKAVLKAQFPGEGGNGFDTPITLTESFLNGLPDKISELEARHDKAFQVGTVMLRLDDVDPNDIFEDEGHVWELVTGDASLCLGDGTVDNVGFISGDNNPIVPIPYHKHTASQSSHAHSRGTMNITGTINNVPTSRNTGSVTATGAFTRANSGDQGRGTGDASASNITLNAANSWTGVTSYVSPSITVQYAGTQNAKLDVRGAQFPVNVWIRTA